MTNLRILREGHYSDYLGGPTIISKVFKRERGKQEGQLRRWDKVGKVEDVTPPALKMGEGSGALEYKQPLEPGRSQELPERT